MWLSIRTLHYTSVYSVLHCHLLPLQVMIYVVTHSKFYNHTVPVPVAARSKVWVCGRSLPGVVGSNTVSAMEACLL